MVVVLLLLVIFKFSIPTIKNYCIKWNTLKYCTRSHSLFSYSHFANACVGAVEFKVTQRQTNYKVNGQSKRFQRVKGLHFLLAPRAPAPPLTENEHFVISFFFSIFTSLLNQLIILCISIFYVYIYIFFIFRIYTIFFGPYKHEFFMWSPPLPSLFI